MLFSHTLGRKNTRPFADFSYKTVIFKRLENNLKIIQKSLFVHQLLILLGDTSHTWYFIKQMMRSEHHPNFTSKLS